MVAGIEVPVLGDDSQGVVVTPGDQVLGNLFGGARGPGDRERTALEEIRLRVNDDDGATFA